MNEKNMSDLVSGDVVYVYGLGTKTIQKTTIYFNSQKISVIYDDAHKIDIHLSEKQFRVSCPYRYSGWNNKMFATSLRALNEGMIEYFKSSKKTIFKHIESLNEYIEELNDETGSFMKSFAEFRDTPVISAKEMYVNETASKHPFIETIKFINDNSDGRYYVVPLIREKNDIEIIDWEFSFKMAQWSSRCNDAIQAAFTYLLQCSATGDRITGDAIIFERTDDGYQAKQVVVEKVVEIYNKLVKKQHE